MARLRSLARDAWSRYPWLFLLLLLTLVFCEAAWLTFLTPNEADIAHYECYGLTFWLGSSGIHLLSPERCAFLQVSPPQPVLHMLPLEYPPLTVLLFSLPLLVPLPYYAFAFALLMTLCVGVVYTLLARSEVREAAPLFLLYLLLGTVGVFQQRFDLLPAACTLVCLLAAGRGRWRLAYLALALGVLLKLYPIVMLPALFLAEQRFYLAKRAADEGAEASRPRGSWLRLAWKDLARCDWRNFLLCLGILCVVTGGFALLNVDEAVLSPLRYFLNRPPQIESLIASVAWIGGHIGMPYTIGFSFGSLNIDSSLVRVLSPVDTLLTIAGLLAVFYLQWSRRMTLAQALTGLVCVLIVTGKVLSPQYLIWLVPLLAYISASGQTNRLWMIAWALISLLTTFIYLFYYSQLPDPQTARQLVQTLPGFFPLVALRNLLLTVTVLAFLCGWWGTRGRLEKPSRILAANKPEFVAHGAK